MKVYGKACRVVNGELLPSVVLGTGETAEEARDLSAQGVSPDKDDMAGATVYTVVSGEATLEEYGDGALLVLEEDVPLFSLRREKRRLVVVSRFAMDERMKREIEKAGGAYALYVLLMKFDDNAKAVAGRILNCNAWNLGQVLRVANDVFEMLSEDDKRRDARECEDIERRMP